MRHKYLNDVDVRGKTVHFEPNFVQNHGLHCNEFILLAVESDVWLALLPCDCSHAVLVSHVIVIFFSFGGFVSWHLSQESARTRHIRVFLIVLCSNKEAAESLHHDLALVHVLVVVNLHVCQESV